MLGRLGVFLWKEGCSKVEGGLDHRVVSPFYILSRAHSVVDLS